MITYDCYECREEFTEENPEEFGNSSYFGFEPVYCCKTCHDKYDGPGDEYYENFAESQAGYAERQYEELRGAGRI